MVTEFLDFVFGGLKGSVGRWPENLLESLFANAAEIPVVFYSRTIKKLLDPDSIKTFYSFNMVILQKHAILKRLVNKTSLN